MAANSSRFNKYAWSFLAYLIVVILFGAWVRITHSGAGCGAHWPTCQGEIVPVAPSIKTLIEYTHRLTSGLCGLFGIVLIGWSWKIFGRGRVTAAAAFTLLFILVEGAVGAGLVLGGLVEDDDSVARAVIIALHLANTLLLVAASTLTARWSQLDIDDRVIFSGRKVAYAIAMLLIGLTAASGAVTALGDTLFEFGARASSAVIDSDHFLVRLRLIHPAVAVSSAAYLLWLFTPQAAFNRWAKSAMHTVGLQVMLGFLNIALSAPGWLQIAHLLVANILWIAVILAAGNCREIETASAEAG